MEKYILVTCEGGLEEFNLETLSKEEMPNTPIQIPVGVEGAFVTKCTIYEVEESKGEESKKEIGEFIMSVGADDGKFLFNLKMSESLLEHPYILPLLLRRP